MKCFIYILKTAFTAIKMHHFLTGHLHGYSIGTLGPLIFKHKLVYLNSKLHSNAKEYSVSYS